MHLFITIWFGTFHLVSMMCMSLLCFIHLHLIIKFRDNNKELFKSVSEAEFSELILNKVFISKNKIINEKNRIKIKFKDIYLTCLFCSIMPIAQIMIFVWLIIFMFKAFNKDTDLTKIYEMLNKDKIKNELSKNENNDILILKKYEKDSNISNIIPAIKSESHPYKEIIKDNLKKLIDIVTNKEFELETTFNITKKEQILKEINFSINKYISLINGIDENMISNDLLELKNLNVNINEILTDLKTNKFNPNISILKHKDKLTIKYRALQDYTPEFVIGTINYLKCFFNDNEFEKIEKILLNDKTVFYKLVSNILILSTNNIKNLDSKLNFLSVDANNLVVKNIKAYLLDFKLLVLELDSINNVNSSLNKEVNDYNDLIDSILEDVKNKRAIF